MIRSSVTSIHRRKPLGGSKRTDQNALYAILYVMIGRLLTKPSSPPGSREAHVHQTLEEAIRNLPHWLEGVALGSEFDLYYRKSIVSSIKRKVRCAALAEDLAQETFLRAFRSVRGGKQLPKHRMAWLRTIARNVVSDHFRKQSRLKEVGLPDAENVGVAASASDAAELADYLAILGNLAGEELADLVRLRLEGHSNEEIAEKTGVAERTVERWWQRLRDIVRDAGLFL